MSSTSTTTAAAAATTSARAATATSTSGSSSALHPSMAVDNNIVTSTSTSSTTTTTTSTTVISTSTTTSTTTATTTSNTATTSLESLFELSGGAVRVAVERCPVCTTTRRPFYCASCVNTGQFNYSNSVQELKQSDDERYCDKLERWKESKINRERYLHSIKPGLDETYAAEKKKWELEHLKEKIRLLKLILTAEKESLQKDVEKLAEDKRLNRVRTERAKVHREKKLRIMKLCDNIKNKIKEQNVILKKDIEKLVKERRSQANILVQYIFPISEIKPNSDSAMELSTESALKDACQTAYMKGFWVYGDKTGDNQYQIVSPTLPANGDFSIYHMSVEAKSEVIPDTEPSHCNPAHTISAALCYTTQLVSVLSYILDVTLPRRQSYIDFCRGDMSKKQFNSAVGRLNQNIVHLCQSQGVPPEEITPMLHLQNILLLLSSPRLGSESPFEAQADIIQSIEKISLSDDSEEDRDSIVDETDSNLDWERVIYEIPEVDRTGQVASYIPNIATSTPMEPQTTAGSIMSTAAASVASLWRAAASHYFNQH